MRGIVAEKAPPCAVVDRLSGLEASLDVARTAIAELEASELEAVLGVGRRLQRKLEALVVRVAARSNELASAGRGPDADQVLLGTGDVSGRRARGERARAETVAAFPALGSALDAGAASGDHLDAVARVAKDLNDEERAALGALDSELADDAARLPPETFGRRLRARIDRDIRSDGGLANLEAQRARSRVRWWADPVTGMGHLRAELDPVRWEAMVNALNAQMRSKAAAESEQATVIDERLAAEVLADLVVGAGVGAEVERAKGRQVGAHLSVVVDANTLLSGYHEHSIHETATGTPLPREAVDHLACDAIIRRVTLDKRGVPVDVGRAYRTATREQWAALHVLYRRCGWWGCDRPIGWCQAHHVIEWTGDDGPTDLDNLVPLCSAHHHKVHEGRWSLSLKANRELEIFTPDGTWWRTAIPDRGATVVGLDGGGGRQRAGASP